MKSNTTVNNTIELIERLATQSSLQGSSARKAAVESADIESALKDSLLNQDIATLESQLNLSNRIRCQGVHPGEAEEESQHEQNDDDEEQKEEAQNLRAIAI
jgi:hypothetical protein